MRKYLVGFLAMAQISCVSGKAQSGFNPEIPARRAGQLDSRQDEGPKLTIKSGEKIRVFSVGDLANSRNAKTIIVEHDPTYSNRRMEYTAVPIADLFAGISLPDDSTIAFTCIDGFSATMAPKRLLNTNAASAIAYIAFEPPNKKWPPIKAGDSATAGPFYLIWQNPEKAKISSEEWPFQIAGFEVKLPTEKLFPHTVPVLNAKRSASQIREGYRLFLKNCFVCHTINGEGMSQVGPDLNIPFNPTEYWAPGFIAKQIRDPQSVRRWPQAKMKAFATSTLSDRDIAAVIAYLKQMATQKHTP